MHIVAFIALILLVALILFVGWLLEAVGLKKPTPIVPSGVLVGKKAYFTTGRDTPDAKRHNDALDKMTTLTYPNGEVWRVLECTPAIDNTYRFTMLRVA